MNFTDGKHRFYENMMREKPNFNRRDYSRKKERRNTADFKYTLANIDCRYCGSYKHCNYSLCPHIMQNLNDLKADKAFISAVENAENCETAQRQTLLYLREHDLCE